MFEAVLRGGPQAADWFESSLQHPARPVAARFADRCDAQPARGGRAARRVVAHVGAGDGRGRHDEPRRRARRHRPRRALPAPPAAHAAEGEARARHGERPVHARRADGEVVGGHAGAALRARRLPAGTAPRGTARRLPADGADGAGPVLPPALRARLPQRRRRAAGQRLQRAGGPCGAVPPRTASAPCTTASTRATCPCSRTNPAYRLSCSPAGSTPSRTSPPWSAPSPWSASTFRTPGSSCSAASRRATRPTRRRCAQLVADLDLEGCATFEGPVSPVSQAFEAGHVVVQSSLSEGLPLTVIEAAMAGRPTVVTDVGGMPEAAGAAGWSCRPGTRPRSPRPASRCSRPTRTRAGTGRRRSRGRHGPLHDLDRFLADVREVYAANTVAPDDRRGERGSGL